MAYIDAVIKKAQDDLEKYKREHGCYPGLKDKRETREEAIARTADEANKYIKQLRQMKNER